MMEERLWNDGWSFWLDGDCGEALPDQGVQWQPVELPHDWLIWDVRHLYQDGTGWYRKTFPAAPQEGRRYGLYFEGVYMDCALFVNGAPAGEWKYGYSSFWFDLTDFLRDGENEVLLRCLFRAPNSRWYSGAGIYRDVWLWELPEVHLVPQSLYLSPVEEEEGRWTVRTQVEAAASGRGTLNPEEYQVRLRLLDGEGGLVEERMLPLAGAAPTDPAAAATYARGEREMLTLTAAIPLERPRLWDVEDPYRYEMQAALISCGSERDCLSQRFGCRTVELSPERGFLLNHRKITLHGVCMHHDLGCLGAAFNAAAAERQLKIVMDMGANALRTGHNMPAPALLDLCDRYGILVAEEAFDCWRTGKNAYDYARFFPEWYQRDVASWVRRDRNHPSVILWSIGNEVYDTHQGPQGMDTTRDLMAEVQRHDPWGNGAATFGSNYMAWQNTQNCADIIKVAGYNYGEKLYQAHHNAHPDWVIYGSETASITQSRGIYHFPLAQSLLVDDDLQCSSLGNNRTSWGAESVEACLRADLDHPFSLGQFIWSGFDYIGEPTPYHTKNSYFGQIDTAGFPKDSFYRYQAGWTDYRTRPMVHLLPYWDFNEGQKIDICVISNAPEVELWVNGVSQGRKALDTRADISAVWQAPYAPGSLAAAAYDGQGRELARTEERSFGDAAALVLEGEKTSIAGDGRELAFYAISAVDAGGNPVRNANNRVSVSVTGPAVLLGLDNGDSTDYDEYKCSNRALFSGKLLAVVGGLGQGGEAEIRVTSPGLAPARLPLTVVPCEQAQPLMPARETAAREDIPVRKIQLSAERQELTPEQPSTVVTAALLPADATYRTLDWRVSDEKGLTVTDVTLEYLDEAHTRVRLTGHGDGQVRVRCTCKNDRPHPQLISALEVSVVGMGSQFPDPYTTLSAALYDHHHGEIGNGNERGIATSRTEMSWVAYDNLDFGRDGADTLAISVFELCGDPTPIRFWLGQPYAPGSRMIGERVYHKPSRWNVYQEETFTLDQRLTGVQAFGIELQCKVHIRDFRFARRSRAWDEIPTVERDLIYGDSYREEPGRITGIGNNVSLVFRGLDFGERGFQSLTIRGRSDLENNTIHVLFQREGEQQRRILEFASQRAWGEQTFPLEPLYGQWDVTFLFLPGCDFDFEAFRFQ